ncbi:TIM barrel protein [Cellulophaga sp. F20128]|uniref:hydroxypyruvate isomerase family protein n=1 Tax=Cellulophaga sp. F20128 TaxID=2926413 RepID=UPI001FF4EEF4|nr:TIM barrel protein [Cellulophaga sp. F20128]MCK0156453.1 TIM barrel protein [Cellulophaga sp. F20128]
MALKNNINHSVCRWCYDDIALEDFLKILNNIGVKAIDLVGPSDWDLLKKYGLDSSMCNGAEISLEKGWNNKEYHSTLIKNYTEMIPLVAEAGYTNLICFSGNRDGMDDKTGMQNCISGLKEILALAEKHQVVLQMELFNQIDHPDYMCDSSAWGVALCKELSSDSFKLLYDIYHMQIQEGDIIQTIRNNHQYFGHYHTAGVPGRNEINNTQELNYPAIMCAIVETGYQGYVAQEFLALQEDKIKALTESILICDV